MAKNINNFLDADGKLKQMPSKVAMEELAYAYLAEKFEAGVIYTEPEVNIIISEWHTFNDYFLLRRGLVESGWLKRLPDGSKYWKNKERMGDEIL